MMVGRFSIDPETIISAGGIALVWVFLLVDFLWGPAIAGVEPVAVAFWTFPTMFVALGGLAIVRKRPRKLLADAMIVAGWFALADGRGLAVAGGAGAMILGGCFLGYLEYADL